MIFCKNALVLDTLKSWNKSEHGEYIEEALGILLSKYESRVKACYIGIEKYK